MFDVMAGSSARIKRHANGDGRPSFHGQNSRADDTVVVVVVVAAAAAAFAVGNIRRIALENP